MKAQIIMRPGDCEAEYEKTASGKETYMKSDSAAVRQPLSTLWILCRIRAYVVFNSSIHAVRCIPFIGKLFGSSYRFSSVKRFLDFVIFPLNFLFWFAGSLVALAFLGFVGFSVVEFLGPLVPQLKGITPSLFIYLKTGSFLILYLIPLWSSSALLNSAGDIAKWYGLYRLPPSKTGKVKGIYEPIFKFFARTTAWILVFCLILQLWNILEAIVFSFALLLFAWAQEALWMRFKLLKRNKKARLLSNMLGVLAQGGFIVLALYSCFMGISPLAFGWIICAIAFIPAVLGIKTVEKEVKNPALLEAGRQYNQMLDELVSKASAKSQVALRDSDLQKANMSAASRLHGYDYLNALFFARHRRKLWKPFLIKVGIFFVLYSVATLAAWFFRESFVFEREIANIVFFIPFVMYLICSDARLTRAMYLNCDQGLLRYGFYKEKKALLSLFKARMRSVLKRSCVPVLVTACFFVGNSLFYSGTIAPVVPHILILLAAGSFFAIYPLFQYYVFQPYNKDGEKTRIAALVLDLLVYCVCVLFIPQLVEYMDVWLFTAVCIVFSVVFVAVSLVLVWIFAPRVMR